MSPNVLHDMVPASVRSEWVASGYYPNKDVYSLFHEWVVSYPDRIAVIDEAASTTYGALDIKVRRVAAAFREAGVEPGDVVGVQLPNSWQACAVELALAAVGAIALPYPVGRAERDVCSMLGRSEAVAAVICGSYGGKDHRAMLDGIRRDLPHLTTVFVLEDEGDTPIADPSSLNAVLADRAADGRWGPLPISPDGPVRMVVTSGTEAAPKMVAYSHNALAGGRGNFVGALAGDCNPMRSFFLVPMGSAFGSSATSVSLARHGATLILCAKFAPDPVINLIERHRPTHLWGVAAMFDMLLLTQTGGCRRILSKRRCYRRKRAGSVDNRLRA